MQALSSFSFNARPCLHLSPIPNRPGLGIEMDYDQLARGRERYAKIPFRKRDDTAEMRKHVDPNWQRILPRW